jgi:hypothetical protein
VQTDPWSQLGTEIQVDAERFKEPKEKRCWVPLALCVCVCVCVGAVAVAVIVLSSQIVVSEKEGLAVSNRRQTPKELLG